MNLKELQSMIKEEFDNYMGEADDMDVAVSDADVDVDAEMGGEEGEDPEAMLRNIYDMLKAKFEAEDEMDGEEAPEMDEMMYDEEESMEEAKKEVEENTNTNVHTQLQERFQKLANIIK
tara:strand:- start:329 stop:685 length:357 start_codon:yes stop_codon:yes gene_type:complete